MSRLSVVYRTKNQLFINTDLTKTFVFNNDFQNDVFYFDNSTSGEVDILEGTVLGRVASTGKLVPFTSAASDGSQIPVGILGPGDLDVEYGEIYDQNVPYCIRGDIAGQNIGLQGSDTLETQVSTSDGPQRVKDLLTKIGLKIIFSSQHTSFDNS